MRAASVRSYDARLSAYAAAMACTRLRGTEGWDGSGCSADAAVAEADGAASAPELASALARAGAVAPLSASTLAARYVATSSWRIVRRAEEPEPEVVEEEEAEALVSAASVELIAAAMPLMRSSRAWRAMIGLGLGLGLGLGSGLGVRVRVGVSAPGGR